MKEQYKEFNFRSSSIKLIHLINLILEDYRKQGYVLTVRQLYYQLVSKNYIPNNEKSYKNITNLVNDARLAGLLDWDMIEDRTRGFLTRPHWGSGREILSGSANQFYMDRWENQEERVFVVVEKEALVGVLERLCREYDIPLLAARGYPSATVLRDFAKEYLMGDHEHYRILHLGDHDPSGIDMTRDLIDRLDMFTDFSVKVQLDRIALTMDQVEEVNPPENPAKSSDSRFKDYAEKYGDSSWELDALSPAYLNKLLESHIRPRIDFDAWEESQEQIDHIKAKIKKVAKDFED